jgi:hypothetical protein
VPVFLTGFKRDRLVDVSITATTSLGGTAWRAPLQYPALSETQASTATAWTSPDGHLLRLTVDVHHPSGSGRGVIELQACEGTPVVPTANGSMLPGEARREFAQLRAERQLRQMGRLTATGLSLRSIAARMREKGIKISHVGVQRVLTAVERRAT